MPRTAGKRPRPTAAPADGTRSGREPAQRKKPLREPYRRVPPRPEPSHTGQSGNPARSGHPTNRARRLLPPIRKRSRPRPPDRKTRRRTIITTLIRRPRRNRRRPKSNRLPRGRLSRAECCGAKAKSRSAGRLQSAACKTGGPVNDSDCQWLTHFPRNFSIATPNLQRRSRS